MFSSLDTIVPASTFSIIAEGEVKPPSDCTHVGDTSPSCSLKENSVALAEIILAENTTFHNQISSSSLLPVGPRKSGRSIKPPIRHTYYALPGKGTF